MKRSQVISLAFSLLGVAAFFVVGNVTKQRTSVCNNFLYQFVMLNVTLLIVLAVHRITKAEYFKVGNLSAQTTPIKLLGIGSKDSWKQIGITFPLLFLLSLELTCI